MELNVVQLLRTLRPHDLLATSITPARKDPRQVQSPARHTAHMAGDRVSAVSVTQAGARCRGCQLHRGRKKVRS